MDKKEVKRIADKEVKSHEKRLHKGAKKMAKGGVTTDAMKSMGRNLARVANQKSG